MKNFYSRVCCAMATFVLIFSLNTPVKAQTSLNTGDLAFSGYISNDPVLFDQFTFVLLVAISPTTVIRFCDFGWRTNIAPGPQFINGGGILESEIVYTNTTGTTIPAGREIRYIAGSANATFTNGGNAGTVTVSVGPQFLVGNFNLASTGDQIFAYQGTFASPLFIAGIHMNVEAGTTAGAWDGVIVAGSQTNNNSELPTAVSGRSLITGTNANWFTTESDNARLLQTAPNIPPLGTDVQCRAALNSGNIIPTNWTQTNVTAGFTLPTGYAYIIPPLSVSIVSFTGKLNADNTVALQWKVGAQQDIQEYIVEKSYNGSDFSMIGTIASVNANSYTYSFIDRQVVTGNNYYRLKTVELSGKQSYSDVVVVNLKSRIKLNIYPNPVTDQLTIQQFGTVFYKSANFYNENGSLLQQIMLNNLQQTVNMKKYQAGVYIVKMDDGTAFKVIKK